MRLSRLAPRLAPFALLPLLALLASDGGAQTPLARPAYNTIQSGGSSVQQQTTLNFVSGFTVANDAGGRRTNVSLAASANDVTINTTAPITGGGTGDTFTLALANSGVSAGAHAYPSSLTVDALGRVTAITAGSAPATTLQEAYDNSQATDVNGTDYVVVEADAALGGVLISAPVGWSASRDLLTVADAAIPTPYLQVKPDGVRLDNLDTTGSNPLIVGGTIATQVEIGRSTLPTQIVGDLEVLGDTALGANDVQELSIVATVTGNMRFSAGADHFIQPAVMAEGAGGASAMSFSGGNGGGATAGVVGGTGGDIQLYAGKGGYDSASQAAGAGGDVILQGGNGGDTSLGGGTSNGGHVYIDGGSAGGAGSHGTVKLGTLDTSGITIGHTLLTTSVLGTVTLSGTVTSSSILAVRHINSDVGADPAILAESGACTSPTVSITGGDTGGRLSVTTGTGCAAADASVVKITWGTAFGALPRVVLTPANANAAALTGTSQVYVADVGFDETRIRVGAGGLTDATPYLWNYIVLE